MDLNKDQQAAYNGLMEYVKGATAQVKSESISDMFMEVADDEYTNSGYALLEGFAGTGKTFTITAVIKAILASNPHISIGMTATTNKAVRVLKKFSDFKEESRVTFATIHSLCGLTQSINNFTGVVKYVADFDSKRQLAIEDVQLLIVDETSMLNEDLFHIIDKYKARYNFKVIFVGDGEQIPPVGEDKAIPFMKDKQLIYDIKMFMLTIPQRQKEGGEIVEAANAVRVGKAITYGTDIIKMPVLTEPIMVKLKEMFVNPKFIADPDYAKVLSYTNKTADNFNRIIRELVFDKKGLPKIIVDDYLIADKPVMQWSMEMERWVVSVSTNEEFKVIKIVDPRFEYVLKYKSYEVISEEIKPEDSHQVNDYYDKLSAEYKLLVDTWDRTAPITIARSMWIDKTMTMYVYKAMVEYEGDMGIRVVKVIDILCEESEKPFELVQSGLKTAALACKEPKTRGGIWRQFYEVANHFAWVKYNYALTTHKSQGSSYDHVLIHEWDYAVNRKREEVRQLKYVAISRARTSVAVVNN